MTVRTTHRPCRGFTLAELLVAVGLVALLTLGVGQLFRSVGTLVTTGIAITEVDRNARVIEAQLRQDFAALRNLDPSETYIVIRGRALGDTDFDGTLDIGPERPIYFNRTDFEEERRLSGQVGGLIDPYGPNGLGFTTRLDEIVFLASEPAGYRSYQPDDPIVSDNGSYFGNAVPTPVQASVARLSIGHGLRPRPEDDPEDLYGANGSLPAEWLSIPDGDFGQAAGENNGFDDTAAGRAVSNEERNRFGAQWVLARQASLLFGGTAAGQPAENPADSSVGELGVRRYAPYIRDQETELRFELSNTDPVFEGNDGRLLAQAIGTTVAVPSWRDAVGNANAPRGPMPRVLRHGRVDIIAQDVEDVRRWLEGVEPAIEPPLPDPLPTEVSDGSAYASGEWDAASQFHPIAVTPFGTRIDTRFEADAPLWVRGRLADTAVNAIPTFRGSGDFNLAFEENVRNLQSAIAGTVTRYLVGTETPRFERARPGGLIDDKQSARDAFMDLHALLATNCSRFEIDWNDGTIHTNPSVTDFVVRKPIGQDGVFDGGGGTPTLRIDVGERVWFGYALTKREYLAAADPTFPTTPAGRDIATDPEILPVGNGDAGVNMQQGVPGATNDRNEFRLTSDLYERPEDPSPSFFPSTPAAQPALEVARHGGVSDEYLAVWPFREIDALGEYGGAYPKPQFVRIRMTLHDPAGRLSEGRDYEFVFRVFN
ncbi:MAG: prepilin-type N-terminal cleavage/methylation domain-containing protein [Planctomycetota bacterium]